MTTAQHIEAIPNSRALTRAEIALFPTDFTRQFDIANVALINRSHNPFTFGKIVVRGNKIYWPNAPKDFTRASMDIQAVLMHELCHVWQYSTGRLTALKYLCNPKNWVYKYVLSEAKSFVDYPIEKQADLMQDWFRLNTGTHAKCFAAGQSEPSCAELNRLIPFDWDAQNFNLV